MQIIEDMIASKGYTKTIAIYPENGIRPYLRCIDSSVYLASIEDVRATEMYRQAILSKGESTWARVSKTDTGTYQANRSDKLVMYREIFDLSKKTPLGYLAIGMEADKITDLCKNAVQQDNEGVVVLCRTGDELVRYGKIDDGILAYIQSAEYRSVDYRKRADSFDYGSYHASVFISHGGFNSVNEALYYGVPIAAIPMVNDQFMTAKRLTALEAGLLLKMDQVTADSLRNCVNTIETSDVIHKNCQRLSRDMRKTASHPAAADRIENWIGEGKNGTQK